MRPQMSPERSGGARAGRIDRTAGSCTLRTNRVVSMVRARIGRVTFSKSGSTIFYGGKALQTLSGRGFKANYFEIESGDEYWISGCHKNGQDRLYSDEGSGHNLTIEIDED